MAEHRERFNQSAATSQVRVEVVRTIAELEPQAAAWNRLAREAPQQLPMLSHAWVASYLEHRLTDKESWLCLFAFDQESLAGVLPVVLRPHPLFGSARPRLETPHDWHILSVDCLSAVGRETEVVPALLTALDKEVPRRFQLRLRRLPETSPTLGVLHSAGPNDLVVEEFDGLGSFVRLEEDFEHFQNTLGGKFKRNLRSRAKSLYKLPGVESFNLKGSSEADYLDSFIKIEASGKKGRGGAITLEQSLIAFYRALVRRLTDPGWLYWQVLQAEGKDIAVNLLVRMGKSFIVCKMCFDEAYGKFAPGSILVNRLIEESCAAGDIRELDFLTDLPWHDPWGMKKRRYYNLYLFPKRPLPVLFGYVPKKIQMLLRKVPGFLPLYHWLRRVPSKGG